MPLFHNCYTNFGHWHIFWKWTNQKSTKMKKLYFLFLIISLTSFGQKNQYPEVNQSIVAYGIFVEINSNEVYPTLLGGIRSDRRTLAVLTFGVIPALNKPFLLSASSKQRSAHKNTTFIFKIPTGENLLFQPFERAFRNAKSPNEFLLIKLYSDAKRNQRRVLKEKNSWSTSRTANLIPFEFIEKESGLFLVNPTTDLEPGEYCFVHQDILTTPHFADFMFFDFSIH